ncbi:MAG: hypothetical protein V4466_00790 [Pseudomonadota bacterium]
MRSALNIAAAVAIAASGFSLPAAAAERGKDLAFNGDSLLAEQARGKSYWVLQSQCAGLFGAASFYMGKQGQAEDAEAAKVQALGFYRDAVDRLVRDRGLETAQATAAVSHLVSTSRTDELKLISRDGLGATTPWNVRRSICLDIADAYKTARYQ